MFVRIYTGDDGETHFEDLPMPEGINWTADQQPATGITFRCVESGNFVDWHVAPRRQYVITLQGGAEIGIGDGTVKRFGPGDVSPSRRPDGPRPHDQGSGRRTPRLRRHPTSLIETVFR